MRKKATSDYIWLGTAIRYLLMAPADTKLGGDGGVLINLKQMHEGLTELELHVSERLFETQNLDELLDDLTGAEKRDKDAALTEAQAEILRAAMRKVRDTVIAEALGVYAYVLSEKRLPTDKLTESVASLFPKGVFKELPDLTQYDFAEAGKCIAFERPTAAAFHLLRGTEGALRDFYLATIKQKRLKTLLWKPMLEQMAAKKTKRPPQPLLDHLDHIRANFRNPTQHPEARYDIDEVQDLFGLCVDAATRMIRAHPNGKST